MNDVDSVAEKVVELFNAGDEKGLFALFDDGMKKAVPEDKLRLVRAGLFAQKGKILARERKGGSERQALYHLKAERGDWQMSLALDQAGKVSGLLFKEPPPPAPPVARSSLPLGLPFRGQWLVFWGGDTPERNQHLDHPSQRRAADLVMVDASGSSHHGDGRANPDYFAYGQEVLAVADGTVITVVDGVPENVPGEVNPYLAPGNMVIVKHADTLYSAYAHLQPGRIRVKPGAKLKRGAVLGLCGNSGNSSEPHLHFQLQDGPLFERSWGVEPVFADVVVSRAGTTEKVKEYTWLKGDRVGEPAR